MKILFLGDIVGEEAGDLLCRKVWQWRKEYQLSLVIANGENLCTGKGNGLDRDSAIALLRGGIDVLTGGNHTWQKQNLRSLLDEEPCVLRPGNYPASLPGSGEVIVDADGYRVLVMNVMGQVYLEPLSDPFDCVEAMLARHKGEYDLSILDIHAEATSEKAAIAHYFDGRISAVLGTHTHVPTADARILPKGTAFQTDLGMCGPSHSILGVSVDCILHKFRTKLPTLFAPGDGATLCQGVLLTADPAKGCVTAIDRFEANA